jgi:hypothetical protein
MGYRIHHYVAAPSEHMAEKNTLETAGQTQVGGLTRFAFVIYFNGHKETKIYTQTCAQKKSEGPEEHTLIPY